MLTIKNNFFYEFCITLSDYGCSNEQNYSKINYIFKNKICMYFTKTIFFLRKNFISKGIFVSFSKNFCSVKIISFCKKNYSVKKIPFLKKISFCKKYFILQNKNSSYKKKPFCKKTFHSVKKIILQKISFYSQFSFATNEQV